MNSTPDRPGRLPRGPHQLSREEVVTSQRDRLCVGALEAVAEQGYAPTTVADIVARARVARGTFYELFGGKEECVAGAFDFAVDVVERRLDLAIADVGARSFRALIRTSLEAYLDILVAEPAAARALHIETLAAGPALLAHRARIHELFAARMLAAGHVGVRDGDLAGEPDPYLIDVLVGGIDDRVRSCLIWQGPDALPTLAPVLYQAALRLLGGAD